MKSYRSLSLRYLKKQKKRSLYTILGIVLAVALVTAIAIIGKSIDRTMLENMKETVGAYHASLDDVSTQEILAIKSHVSIVEVGTARSVGLVEVSGKTVRIELDGADETTDRFLNRRLISGHLPVKRGEIAMDRLALETLGVEPAIGTNLYIQIADGSVSFDESGMRLVLVGIFETRLIDRERLIAYSQVTLDFAAELLGPLVPESFEVYYTVKDPSNARRLASAVSLDLGLHEKERPNYSLLEQLEKSSKPNLVIVFLGILVALAAAVSIYNIIHISVLERIRDFGLLRAAGAAASQIRQLVYRESLLSSLVAVPLGIVAGCGLALIIIRFSGTSLLSIGALKMVISGDVLIVSAVLGIFSIFISTMGPAREASRVSPVEAIKNYGNLGKESVKKKKKGIGKFFGITFQLAYQNMWRNHKRTVTTLFSMSLSVTLFIVFGYLASSMNIEKLASSYVRSDYSIQTGWAANNGPNESDLETIKRLPGVEGVIAAKYKTVAAAAVIEPNGKGERLLEMLINASGENGETKSYPLQSDFLGYNVAGIERLKELVIEGKVDFKTFREGLFVAITRDDSKEYELEVGDEIRIRNNFLDENGLLQEENLEFVIAAIVDRVPSSMYGRSPGPQFLGSEMAMEKHFSNNSSATNVKSEASSYHYSYIDVFTEKANSQVITAELKRLEAEYPLSTLRSYVAQREQLATSKRQLTVMVYGLIVVIGIIASLSIINTITTNIILRQREFGILRAIGITREQLRKMIVIEGALFGFIGTFWGVLAGTVLSGLLFPLLQKEMGYLSWSVPWLTIVIAAVACTGLGAATTIGPIKRMSRMNLVDSIRTVD